MLIDGHRLNQAIREVETIINADKDKLPHMNEYYNDKDKKTVEHLISRTFERFAFGVRRHCKLQAALQRYNILPSTSIKHNENTITLAEALKLRNGLEKKVRAVLQQLQKAGSPERYSYRDGPIRITSDDILAKYAFSHDDILVLLSKIDKEIALLRSAIGKANSIVFDIDSLTEDDLLGLDNL